ncbi:hypothetical protein [Metabacillus litoralis]|uniref:hypothetical protein n=1 Tax=Metabacillus litoralis TaxID=152268 RepID=UPI002040E81D|nr:hypothetical protein [Metabacillus litoralis]MCM3651293.1 hypothetical protein [Metabacillus litoralis]
MRDFERDIHVCDSCKKDVDEKGIRYVPTVKEGKINFLDCCPSCAKVFMDFMGIKS